MYNFCLAKPRYPLTLKEIKPDSLDAIGGLSLNLGNTLKNITNSRWAVWIIMASSYDDFYCKTDFRHFKQDHVYVQMLCSFLTDLRHRSVLDVGCGRGYWSHLFHECGVGRVVGVDLSQTGLDVARREVPACEFILADAKQLQFADNTFDMVFCQGLSEYNTADLAKAQSVGQELLRCLKDTGLLVFANSTNLSGKSKNAWVNHRKETILRYLTSLNCQIEATYFFDRAIFLRLLGRNVIRKFISDYVLPFICHVTGFPALMVCIARKKTNFSPVNQKSKAVISSPRRRDISPVRLSNRG
jgi:ubiquinone/menaquinone biosynthesis C-methylase UbiE